MYNLERLTTGFECKVSIAYHIYKFRLRLRFCIAKSRKAAPASSQQRRNNVASFTSAFLECREGRASIAD